MLFVGLGGIGQRHLRNLKLLIPEGLEIIAYRERNLSRIISNGLVAEDGCDLESTYGMTIFPSLIEALAQEPSIAFICNPTSMHLATAKMAAQQGCHLFIEKALSDSMDGVSELIEIAEQKKLVCMVGYQLRFHPCLTALKSIVEGGALGRIVAVNAEVGEYMPGWHKYEDYRYMYAAQRSLGGGVILSQIHEYDYLLWLFGFPSKIFAIGGHLSGLEIDVEDIATVVMQCHKNGQSIPVHLHQDYLQKPPTRTCKVIGEKGKVMIDLMALNVLHIGENGEVQQMLDYQGFDRNQSFIDELQHFLSCCEAKIDPIVNLKEGALSLQMALAAQASLETGSVMDLSPMF